MRSLFATAFLTCLTLAGQTTERGFVPLFDGKTLKGWTLVDGKGPGYVVANGILVCPADGGGNLFTNKEYANFILRFEFRLFDGSNNGIGIRSPLAGDGGPAGHASPPAPPGCWSVGRSSVFSPTGGCSGLLTGASPVVCWRAKSKGCATNVSSRTYNNCPFAYRPLVSLRAT